MRYRRIDADRKSIGIQVVYPGDIIIRAPEEISSEKIQETIENKKDWIKEKQQFFRNREKATDYEFYDGEKFPYMGRWYRLKIRKGEPSLKFYQGKFLARSTSKNDDKTRTRELRPLFLRWYNQRAENSLVKLAKKQAYIFEKDIKVNIYDLKISWGYSKQGKIFLNWRLIMAPKDIQKYVITHELLHQDFSKHGKEFWNRLDSYVPKRKEHEDWLQKYGKRLDV
ncbi:DUF45 domain-containing protein [Candidatus Woesearchaeota archaeon]|nr:DUF45 domain-containing protein [Candidatus Woesearchaeota archaeon]